MFNIYESDFNGVKRYYRAGQHSITERFEFYVSFDQETWRQIEIVGGICDEQGFVYNLAGENQTLTILYEDQSLLLNKHIVLKEISHKDLPPELYDTELRDIDRLITELERTCQPSQPALTEEKTKPIRNRFYEQPKSVVPLYKQPDEIQNEGGRNCLTPSMLILGLFITAVGIAAVAFAFIAINAMTMGTFFAIGAIGGATLLLGLGLFGGGLYRSCKSDTPEPGCLSSLC